MNGGNRRPSSGTVFRQANPRLAVTMRRLDLRRLSAVLFGASALLSVSSLALAWYTVTVWNGAVEYHETFYLHGVRLAGTTSAGAYDVSASYSSVWLPHTGELYLVTFALVLAGVLLASLSALVCASSAARATPRTIRLLTLIAVLVAATAPTLVWAAQPAVVCSDYGSTPPPLGASVNGTSAASCGWAIAIPGSPGSGYSVYGESTPGPQSSFVGFETGTYYHSWDASVGWFAEVAGVAVALAGAVIASRSLRPGRS